MGNEIRMSGLLELRQQLRTMPVRLRNAAAAVVEGTARDVAAQIIAAYPEVTGNLKRGVRVEPINTGPYGVAFRVVNRAKHAWLYENGSQARAYISKRNRVQHETGRMSPAPPGRAMIPKVARARRVMEVRLRQLLESEGLVVTNAAA